jgi:RNA polymerase sigma factor (sigma-70 family)
MFGWRSGNETLTRSQDSELFLALLEPVRDSLHRFAVRNVWRRDQVTDVLQEAVMTGWRHFGKFERGTNFRAWMFKILLNTLYRINRKSHRTREVRFEADMFDAGAFDAGQVMDRETAWASILDDPERVMEALDERVVQALDTLAPTERQCFLLRLAGGLQLQGDRRTARSAVGHGDVPCVSRPHEAARTFGRPGPGRRDREIAGWRRAAIIGGRREWKP